jgi:hypothetical protein
VFIEASAEPLHDSDEAAYGLAYLQAVRETIDGTMGTVGYFTGNAPQRIYRATSQRVWVNQSDRDNRGNIIRDRRVQIQLQDLL